MNPESGRNGNGTDNRSAPAVKPEVALLDDLFDEVARGRLRIPAFQRPFVWKPSDMLALFESIYLGYPIGSLLLWDTSEEYASRGQVGPITIPPPERKPVAYLLDGQQRLSTLYGTLRLPPSHPNSEAQADWRWWIWYDLRNRVFCHHPGAPAPPHLLPVRALLRTVDFLQFSRELVDKLPRDSESLLEEAERVVQKVKSYKFTVTRIQGGSLKQAVEIFSRLNTRGRPMKADEMISALTYREGPGSFHLSQRIDEILRFLAPYSFEDINRVFIFRAIIATAGQDVLRTDWNQLVKALGAELPTRVQDAEHAIIRAVGFLSEDLGIPGTPLLPYGYQLLVLVQFFLHCAQPTVEQKNLLKRWFWTTSFSGWFAGANSTQIAESLHHAELFAKDGNPQHFGEALGERARPYPVRFDMRSARVRVLLLTLLRLRPRAFGGDVLDVRSVLAGHPRGLPYVFPRATGEFASNPANRMLLPPEAGRNIRSHLLNLPSDVRDKVLASHGITAEAYAAIESKDAGRFIELRARHLAEIERSFMQEMGIAVPRAEFGESDVDTDDEE